jgi:hypothetical protein
MTPRFSIRSLLLATAFAAGFCWWARLETLRWNWRTQDDRGPFVVLWQIRPRGFLAVGCYRDYLLGRDVFQIWPSNYAYPAAVAIYDDGRWRFQLPSNPKKEPAR